MPRPSVPIGSRWRDTTAPADRVWVVRGVDGGYVSFVSPEIGVRRVHLRHVRTLWRRVDRTQDQTESRYGTQ